MDKEKGRDLKRGGSSGGRSSPSKRQQRGLSARISSSTKPVSPPSSSPHGINRKSQVTLPPSLHFLKCPSLLPNLHKKSRIFTLFSYMKSVISRRIFLVFFFPSWHLSWSRFFFSCVLFFLKFEENAAVLNGTSYGRGGGGEESAMERWKKERAKAFVWGSRINKEDGRTGDGGGSCGSDGGGSHLSRPPLSTSGRLQSKVGTVLFFPRLLASGFIFFFLF